MGAPRREQLGKAAADHLLAAGRVEEAAARMADLPPRCDARVVATLTSAAARASQRGAPDVAASLLRRALAEPPSPERMPEVRAALGAALMALGDPEATVALELALALADPGPRSARVASQLGLALLYQMRSPEAIALLDRCAEDLRGAFPELAEELEALALSSTSFDPAFRDERVRRLQRWRDRRGASELAHCMRLAECVNESLGRARPAADTIDLAERALTHGVLLSRAVGSHAFAVMVLAYAGRPEAARTHLEDAISRARDAGDLARLSVQFGFLGEVHRMEGDLIAAENDLRTGMELATGPPIGGPFMVRGVVESLLEQNAAGKAEAELRKAGLTGVLPPLISSAGLVYARGRTRIAAGALQNGLDDMLHVGQILAQHQNRDPQSVAWRIDASEVYLRLGDVDHAYALMAEQLELARCVGTPFVIGPALRLQGRVQLALGDAGALASLHESVRLLTGSFARLELARALVDLGMATRLAGDQVAARRTLEKAATLAEELGSVVLTRQSNAELVAAGGRPRRSARRGVLGLTPTERRVAILGAESLTNREIAEAFVISEKTVETHMTSAFRKLGIRTRAELSGVLARRPR
jgi:DNA-binding CsgD family transcriptional regulator